MDAADRSRLADELLRQFVGSHVFLMPASRPEDTRRLLTVLGAGRGGRMRNGPWGELLGASDEDLVQIVRMVHAARGLEGLGSRGG